MHYGGLLIRCLFQPLVSDLNVQKKKLTMQGMKWAIINKKIANWSCEVGFCYSLHKFE